MMKYAIVIEHEPKLLAEIAEGILLSDSKTIIRCFFDQKSFENWFALFRNNDSASLKSAGFNIDEALESPTMRARMEEARVRNGGAEIKLLGKEQNEHLVLFVAPLDPAHKEPPAIFQEYLGTFASKGFCTKESKTGLLLTTFDNPNFKIKNFTVPNLSNVIFKPFDKAILNQQILQTMSGNQVAKGGFIFQQESKAIIEMIKEGELEGFSEVGIITKREKRVDNNVISKIYSNPFQSEETKSLIATCSTSEPSPSNPSEFLNYFKFFGIKTDQLHTVRKNVRESKSARPKPFKTFNEDPKSKRRLHVAILGQDRHGIQESLERNFRDITCTISESAVDLLKLLKAQPALVDSVIFLDTFFVDDPIKQAQNFKEQLDKTNLPLGGSLRAHPLLYLVSTKIYGREAERSLASVLSNLFYEPFDRGYFIKQFYTDFRFLSSNESPIELNYIPSPCPMKIGNTVAVTGLSEAAINLQYPRPMGLGEYRKFILTSENESEMMEILGRCNFVAENKEKKTFDHQFVFFGLTDLFLKSIRIWIRNSYVHSKESA